MLYEFNFDLFCRTYSLPPAPTRSALTLLSRAGYFEYIDETTSRSRLMVIMRKDQLYDLELTPDAEEVFQCVLRNYTGLFADYVYISELVIARSTCLSSERVYQGVALPRTHPCRPLRAAPHHTLYILQHLARTSQTRDHAPRKSTSASANAWPCVSKP